MPTYLHPGVYIEELPGGARPIEAVGTSTAAFVGFATRGPVGVPVRISSWDEYVRGYGGITGGDDLMGLSVAAYYANGGSAAYIVRLAAGAEAADGFLLAPGADPANPQPNDRLMRFVATSPGPWGDGLRVTFEGTGGDRYALGVDELRAPAPGLEATYQELERFTDLSADPADPRFVEAVVTFESQLVDVALETARPRMVGESVGQPLPDDFAAKDLNTTGMKVTVNGEERDVAFPTDFFSATSTPADVAAEIQKQVRGPSVTPAVRDFTCSESGRRLVLRSGEAGPQSSVKATGPGTDDAAELLLLGPANGGTERTGAEVLAALLTPGTPVSLTGGTPGGSAPDAAYTDVFSAFLKIRDINIIVLPGKAWDENGQAAVQAAIAHAETAMSRIVIVDPPRNVELTSEADVAALELTTSTYAALYYPWVDVPNPDYNADTNPAVPRTVLVPPSGFAAGMWSRIDTRRGVWKAPAGTETGLLGLSGLRFVVEDAEQDVLNPAGVNCLRSFPGFGRVIWGARTRSTRANPEWRYVPVRRTAIFIEQSIYNGIQWAVFEPNDDRLWASLRAGVDSFMDGLFRSGAFQGTKASDAYFVKCGIPGSMNQNDVDAGKVIVLVGFAPLKPAEFVIVRIQQKVGQQ